MLAVHSGWDSQGCHCFQNAAFLPFLIANIISNCVCVLKCWMKRDHSGGLGCFQAEAIALLASMIPCTVKGECEDFQDLWSRRNNAEAGLQVKVAWEILERKDRTCFQNISITGQDHQMCRKDPVLPHSLQQSEVIEMDILESLAGV